MRKIILAVSLVSFLLLYPLPVHAETYCSDIQSDCESQATGTGCNYDNSTGQWCTETQAPDPNYQPIYSGSGPIDFFHLNLQIGQKFTTVGGIVNAVIPILFVIAGFFLLYYLVSGGFSLMFSKGDQRAVEGAKAKVTNAVVGFVILFVAYWLVQLLGEVLDISIFKQLFS